MPRSVPAIPGTARNAAYSELVEANGQVFIAGPVGDPEGTVGFAAEARAAYDNVGHLLRAVGLDFRDVVRCTIYLRDLDDFAAAGQIFRERFPSNPPVRTTVEDVSLVRDQRIEIEVTAAR